MPTTGDSNDASVEFAPVIKVQVSKDGTDTRVGATLEGDGTIDGDLQVTGSTQLSGVTAGALDVSGAIRMLSDVDGTFVELAFDSANDRFTIKRHKLDAVTKQTTFSFADL